jgi:hypothetical protein
MKRIGLAWAFPASSIRSKPRGALAPVAVAVINAPAVMPVIPGPDVNHSSWAVPVVVVPVWIVPICIIAVRIVPVWITVPVVSVPDWKTKSNPHRDPRLCPRCRGQREGTNCQADQNELFPIHIKSSLKLIIEHNLRRKLTKNYSKTTASLVGYPMTQMSCPIRSYRTRSSRGACSVDPAPIPGKAMIGPPVKTGPT